MRILSRGSVSPYEVRCSRCDVTFPIDTRKCIHCGGPTSPVAAALMSNDIGDLGRGRAIDVETDGITTRSTTTVPDSAAMDGSFVLRESDMIGEPRDEYGEEYPYTPDASDHGPPSFVQSLVRSLGSVIWIVLLVAFSLYRSCGN